jgi:hypothetical protein
MIPGRTSLLFCSWGIGIVDVTLWAASMEHTRFNPTLDLFKPTAAAENKHTEANAKKSLDAYPCREFRET